MYILTIYEAGQGLRHYEFEAGFSLIKGCQYLFRSRHHEISKITTQIQNITTQLLTMYIGNFISQLTTLLSILHNTNKEKIKHIRILTKHNINTHKDKGVSRD